jgi:hypothetical protein
MGVRAGLRVAALAALVVLLTGCVKLDMRLSVATDDTVSGTVVVAFSRQLLSMTGQSADQLFKGAVGGTASPEPGVTTSPYQDDRFVGQQVTLDRVPIEQLGRRLGSSGTGTFTIERVGDEFHVTGELDLIGSSTSGPSSSSGPSAGPSASASPNPLAGMVGQLMGSAEIEISISFPGKVINANGRIDGNTVTWMPAFGQRQSLQAVASALASDRFPWLWVAVGVAVLVLALLVLAIVLRRRHAAPAAEEPLGTPPPAEGAAVASETAGDLPGPPAGGEPSSPG